MSCWSQYSISKVEHDKKQNKTKKTHQGYYWYDNFLDSPRKNPQNRFTVNWSNEAGNLGKTRKIFWGRTWIREKRGQGNKGTSWLQTFAYLKKKHKDTRMNSVLVLVLKPSKGLVMQIKHSASASNPKPRHTFAWAWQNSQKSPGTWHEHNKKDECRHPILTKTEVQRETRGTAKEQACSAQ